MHGETLKFVMAMLCCYEGNTDKWREGDLYVETGTASQLMVRHAV